MEKIKYTLTPFTGKDEQLGQLICGDYYIIVWINPKNNKLNVGVATWQAWSRNFALTGLRQTENGHPKLNPKSSEYNKIISWAHIRNDWEEVTPCEIPAHVLERD